MVSRMAWLLSPKNSDSYWNLVRMPTCDSSMAALSRSLKWNLIQRIPRLSCTSSHRTGQIGMMPTGSPYRFRTGTMNAVFFMSRMVDSWYMNCGHTWNSFGAFFSFVTSCG